MYFSYLRCKQFELLALREIVPILQNPALISPVLEPVKTSTSSFERAIDVLVDRGMNFSIIINPQHGEFVNNNAGILRMINAKLQGYNNFQTGILLHSNVNLALTTEQLEQLKFDSQLTLIHSDRVNDIDSLTVWCADHELKYNLYG
jgi:hypothetical protein